MSFEPVSPGFIGTPDLPDELDAQEPQGSVLRAAVQTENTLGSFLASRRSVLLDNEEVIDTETDFFEQFSDAKYDPFLDRVATVRNQEDSDNLKADLDREIEQKETLSSAGATGFAAMMAAGFFDLPTLIPGTAAVRTAKTSVNMLRTAGQAAKAGAVDAAISETLLRATQQTRSLEESGVAIAGSVVLSGILGGAIGAAIAKADVDTMSAKIEGDFTVPKDGDPDIFMPGSVKVGEEPSPAFQRAAAGAQDPDTRALGEAGAPVRDASVGASAAEQVDNALVNSFGVDKIVGQQDPTFRLLRSKSRSANETVQELTETVVELEKFKRGQEAAPGGTERAEPGAVETRIKFWTRGAMSEAYDVFDENFIMYKKGRRKRFGDRALIGLGDALGRNANDTLTFRQFDEQVDFALRNGDNHEIPEVRRTAKWVRKNVLDPLKDRAIETELEDGGTMLPEGVEVETATSYFMRSYDTDRIIADPEGFDRIVTAHLEREAEVNAGIRDRLRPLLEEHETLAKQVDDAEANARLNEVIEQIEDEVLEFRGKRTKEAKAAVKAREAAAEGRDPSKPRLRAADKPVLKAARKIIKDTELEAGELPLRAAEIRNRIINAPEGRLPYDAHSGPNGEFRDARSGLASPLRAREFDIPDNDIAPFLDKNALRNLARYTRSMASDIEIARRFGSIDLGLQRKQINEEFDELIRQANSPQQKKRLQGQKDRANKDVVAIVERMRGTFATSRDPHGWLARSGRVVKSLNYLRFLGGMTVSAIPDLGRTVMLHGMVNTYRDGLVPMLKGFGTTRLAGKELESWGTSADMTLDTRAMLLADVAEPHGRLSRFERGLENLSSNFGIVSLMAPWNSEIKKMSGRVVTARIMRAARKVEAGKASEKEIQLLARGGISEANARRIAKEFASHGEETSGVFLPNTAKWDNKAAAEALRAAVVKDVDKAIVTPGQDKPIFMSTDAGGMVAQFMSFATASTQRTLISGLQQRDMAALNGMVLSIALGALVTIIKEKQAGREVDTNFDDPEVLAQLLVDGIDRSGLTGWLMDANSKAEALTAGQVGFSALTGKTVSRYRNRNLASAMIGPTAGTINDLARVIGSAAIGDFKESDVRVGRRLIPYNNVFYVRGLWDEAEKGVAAALGVSARKGSALPFPFGELAR